MAIHPIEAEHYESSRPTFVDADLDVGHLSSDSNGRIELSSITYEAGLERPVVRLSVSDGYEDVPGRHEITETLKWLEGFLQDNPHIGLNDPGNKAKDWVYSTPTIYSWASLMPSAAALYPLQRPEANYLPNGVPVDERARDMFMHSPDAVGIRTRANIMSLLTKRFSREFVDKTQDRPMRWVSIACGAAVPVLDAFQDIQSDASQRNVPDVDIRLIDRDQDALDFARQLAESQGLELPEDSYMNRDIVKGLLAGDSLIEEIGSESVDFVDMLGIFEYFGDRAASQLLRQANKLVAPGGKIVLANMLDTHPNLELNQRGVGWPLIHPRSLPEVAAIVRDAGLDEGRMQIFVPQDNVYGVAMITKPELDVSTETISGARLASVRSLGHLPQVGQ